MKENKNLNKSNSDTGNIRHLKVPERLWKLVSKASKNSRSVNDYIITCLLYTSPSPRDGLLSRMPSSA